MPGELRSGHFGAKRDRLTGATAIHRPRKNAHFGSAKLSGVVRFNFCDGNRLHVFAAARQGRYWGSLETLDETETLRLE